MLLLVAIVAAIALTLRHRAGTQGAGHRRAGGGARQRPRAHREDGRGAAPMITLAQLLTLSAMLFALSVAGIFLNRKNVHPAADVHRAAAAGRQLQLHRLLALPGDSTARSSCSSC